MMQWINLNQNNRSMLVRQYSVLWEWTGHIFQPLEGLMESRQHGRSAGKMLVGFKIFKILCSLNYFGFYFVQYHNNFTTLLELHLFHFCEIKFITKCVLKYKKWVAIFKPGALGFLKLWLDLWKRVLYVQL